MVRRKFGQIMIAHSFAEVLAPRKLHAHFVGGPLFREARTNASGDIGSPEVLNAVPSAQLSYLDDSQLRHQHDTEFLTRHVYDTSRCAPPASWRNGRELMPYG